MQGVQRAAHLRVAAPGALPGEGRAGRGLRRAGQGRVTLSLPAEQEARQQGAEVPLHPRRGGAGAREEDEAGRQGERRARAGAVGSELSAAVLPELLLCPCTPRKGSVVKLCR